MNPRILLVEDDPTTRAYLTALTEALPARTDGAASIAQALRHAAAARYDLWLVDANLPDGTGIELLQRLRAIAPRTPALAHTAAQARSELEPLHAAGFEDVLVKPVDAGAWHAAIRRALGRAAVEGACESSRDAGGQLLLWDEAAAARALGGNSANVAALRGLFLSELPAQVAAIREVDGEARRAQLHRLRASCAFVGACRLEDAVRRLQERMDDDALQLFVHVAEQTLAQPPTPPA